VEQGFAGFIFYRKSKNICERKEEPSPENEEEKLTETEQTEPVAPVVDEEVAESEMSPLTDEQLERLVEVKSFVDQLKKEIRAKGLCTPDEKLEETCATLHEELRREVITGSGAYIEFLEADEEIDNLPPHPMDTQLVECIRRLQQKIDMCERETQEWEELMETKRTEAQATTLDLENDLGLDLSQLCPEDEAKLATHLSPEPRRWLEGATRERSDREWERATEQDIRTVSSNIDGALERIHTYCDRVLQRCSEETHQLGLVTDLPTQTPRTLFRALKETTH
jgi:hypothetical protein